MEIENKAPVFYCRDVWRTVVIDNRGRYRLCGISKLNIESDWANFGQVETMTISEYLQSIKAKRFRSAMALGDRSVYASECETCLNVEDSGLVSRRQRRQILMGDWDKNLIYPEKIHFELGNMCVFKCRMCSQEFSHLIAHEYRELGWLQNSQYYSPKGLLAPYELNELFLADFKQNMKTIKFVKFTGGEPLINPLFKKITDFISHSGSTETTIEIITNLQKVPWEWFENYQGSIEISVSLDAVGARGEYIRRGLNFELFEKNLQRLLSMSNVKVDALISFQALNMEYIPETYDYLQSCGLRDIGANIVSIPNFMSPRVVPEAHKEKIKNKLDKWSSEADMNIIFKHTLDSAMHDMNKPGTDQLRQTFVNFNKILDSRNIKGPQFKDLYPEYFNI